MNIEELKQSAKQGNVSAQVDLAHAYLKGEGVAKNRKYYLNWLTKASENGDLPSQIELINVLRDKQSRYSNPKEALRWMKIAQQNGASFNQEELARVGDPEVCTKLTKLYLFDPDKHDFNKAKDLLLRFHPEKEVVLEWARKYHARHIGNKTEQSNIRYLYLLSSEGNAQELNRLAVKLLTEDDKKNIIISFSLFREAYRLGDTNATASYFYCLAYGKGTRKNLKEAVKVYFKGKENNVSFDQCYATDTSDGITLNLPTSTEWKRLCAHHKTKSIACRLRNPVSNFF